MNRLLLALSLAALSPACAHAGALKVTVLDKEGRPVPDAVVVLAPAGLPCPARSP